MASRGNRKILKNGLTPKENALKTKVIEQIRTTGDVNGTQAVLEVYNTKNRSSAGKIASEVLGKPEIKREIEKELEAAGLSTEKSIRNIGKLAEIDPATVKMSGETLLKANLTILKMFGMDPDKMKGTKIKKKVETLSFDEAKNQLKSMSMESTEFIQEVGE